MKNKDEKNSVTVPPKFVLPKAIEDQLRKGFHVELYINKDGQYVSLKIQKEKLTTIE